ncbi:hypothetical protein QTI51_01220 [Variovorax sp. J22G73]|uniref:hypothetical protein n=1 Tax=unclassified Variovorax TaxID=663243 RepID=UPI002574D283|nr:MULTISPECIES: hypothetical protein [unclassified Variovorax]MDM0004456.1 hypothetical protein [Variovorax sp. J22R203]MDM0095878.1 hypothetical protein [Variovorax sp. J22G73]
MSGRAKATEISNNGPGKNGRIFIFTRSGWDEQPRLRHQVAKLLVEAGEEVHFFQGSRYLWQKVSSSDDIKISNKFYIHRSAQLLHLQLRLTSLLGWINGIVEARSIKKSISGGVRLDDVVINFNYDFSFLRKLFVKNKIVTIINDDFIAQAKFFKGGHVRESLKKTCAISNEVLAVSYPLIEQLKNWCKPKLFLPWADVPYTAPMPPSSPRNAVLLWAYIDVRIDFTLLCEVAKSLPNSDFHIYGDHFWRIEPEIKKAMAFPNIFFKSSARLDNIDLRAYYAAIIPYKSGVADIEAVTLSNKSFQLLARGLPLVTSGMPNFFKHPSIHNTSTTESFIDALNQCSEEFSVIQPSIEEFVQENQPSARYEQLVKIWTSI